MNITRILTTLSITILSLAQPYTLRATPSFTLATMNCEWFFDANEPKLASAPQLTHQQYLAKAQNLINLLPNNPPLCIALQEVGTEHDAATLAATANTRYRTKYQTAFAKGRDTYTQENVAALVDTTQGWGIYGRPARSSDLDRQLSKHLLLVLTNRAEIEPLVICVVHLRVPRDTDGVQKHREQIIALLKWSMNWLANKPRANLVILGDWNQPGKPNDPTQDLAILTKSPQPNFFDAVTLCPSSITHPGSRGSFDRILVSPALTRPNGTWQLSQCQIIAHKEYKNDLVTDHYPVVATFQKPPKGK